LISQVVVDAQDEAFAHPTKPIGPFYDAQRAAAMRASGFTVIEDAGRGYRRVVPSPRPLEVIDAPLLAQLIAQGAIVIAAGGGGVPVIREGRLLRGVEAVVDKDRSAALLADVIAARLLLILTGAAAVFLDYGCTTARPIRHARPAQMLDWLARGHFPPGSMGPKVEAAAHFVAGGRGRRAVICDPASLTAALAGQAGTTIEEP
jgi:carbamate kinase